MRKILAALCLGALLGLAGCGQTGDDPGTEAEPTDRAGTDATADAGDAGEDGGEDGDGATDGENGRDPGETADVNRPREGTYVYTYASESTNASTPTATPRRAAEDAELTSKVTHDGNVVVTEEKTSEGPAVATVRWRWLEDRVEELSFETKTERGTSGCRLETPVVMLRIPIKAEKFETQELDGTGTSCDGQREITVDRRQNIEDDDGKTWSTWRIVYDTQVRAPGVTNRSTIIRWFSPELGKDIKIETTSELVNASGGVSVRGESTSLLTTYPS